jgi:uncharacterized protein
MTGGPRSARIDLKPFESSFGHHLFVADGSRIFDIDEATKEALTALLDGDTDDVWRKMGFPGRPVGRWINGNIPPPPPPKSLSLNVAQTCNLSCGYCYADGGRFGGAPRMMDISVARRAVDMLLAETAPGSDIVIGFMGGEPLLARGLIAEVAEYASRRGAATGHAARFSITTNGTLLTDDDARLFSDYPFAVQLSLDGPRTLNDLQRPTRSGSGSYDRVLHGLDRLTQHKRPLQLTARATVTSQSGGLLQILEHLIALPFDDVGFALALVAPPGLAVEAGRFDGLLGEMVECGEKTLNEVSAGRSFPFSNFLTAMDEIHRGTHRPYPCGAGAAYLSVNAEGRTYACHRTIDDSEFALGDLDAGLDHAARQRMLVRNHVDSIDPCRSCWARYLCGGGCYHEVARRGRPGCDYIRGWLEFCLKAYVQLSAVMPGGYSGQTVPPEGAAPNA